MKNLNQALNDDRICVMRYNQSYMNFHKHTYYEMVYVAKGRIIHCLKDKKIEVKKGDYFIIDIDDNHGYIDIPGEKCEIYNCLFYPEFIDPTLKSRKKFSMLIESYLIKFDTSILKYNPTTYLFHDDDERIFSLIKNIEKESEMHKHGYTELMRCNLIEILVTTMRKISSQLNYSLPYVSMKFKKDTGYLFSEYLQKKRVEESARLLANTSQKLSDISLSVGYDDVKFFTKIFKKYMNSTPTTFRNLLKGHGENI